ncbi:MAG: carboxypeptidase regulatory-like domain-containing protein [Anaerohalosphaeraceae bacterium]|jgi:hypothetical protein
MKGTMMRLGLIAVTVVLAAGQAALGLIGVGGSEPVTDRGWPEGTVTMANLPSRAHWWEGPSFGGGLYGFQYRCNGTAEFNEALRVFAAIASDRHEVVVHNGPRTLPLREKPRMDWTFTAWVADNWKELFNNPKSVFMADHPDYGKPMPAPWIDVYVGGGGIVWDEVIVPEGVTVVERRPGAIGEAFAGKGLVRCRVFDLDTKKPLAGAEVVVAEYNQEVNPRPPLTGKTDANGSCEIAQIPLANYTVSVRADGYAPRKIGSYGNTLPEYFTFETHLTRFAAIWGFVVDTDMRPVANAKVSAGNAITVDGLGYMMPEPYSAITDERGMFQIASLPVGSVTLRCRAGDMHLTNSIFELYPVPSEGVRLVMTKTSVVRGKVYTKEWQTPKGNVHVTIRPVGEQIGKWGGSMRVQEDGSFEFKGVPPGDYLVGIGGMIETEEEKKKATLVSVRGDTVYEVELLQDEARSR